HAETHLGAERVRRRRQVVLGDRDDLVPPLLVGLDLPEERELLREPLADDAGGVVLELVDALRILVDALAQRDRLLGARNRVVALALLLVAERDDELRLERD